MTTHTSDYAINSKVRIDVDRSVDPLTGVVTALGWRGIPTHHIVQVAYVFNGVCYEVWFEDYRLSRAPLR